MSVVEAALKRPYTVAAMLILITLMGIGAALRMPIDIFPEIDIPVVAVVWTYNGMSAQDIQNRILTLHQRQLASLVDDISRIEAVSYEGVGVEKVYLHEGADVTRAVSQLASSALVVLKYMPPNITPPYLTRSLTTSAKILFAPHLRSFTERKFRTPMAANPASSWQTWIWTHYQRAVCPLRM